MTQTASTGGALTADELKADLTLDQLQQLVGLVEYDATNDPFPVTAMDAVCFVVGNATQSATFYQLALGMELEAYRGPETGVRDPKSYVLRSGSARFVFTGGVVPNSPVLDHHRQHGDGVVDLSLEVPDVDKCIAHARSVGATILVEPHDETAPICRVTWPAPRPWPAARVTRSGCFRPSITVWATSSSGGWTNG